MAKTDVWLTAPFTCKPGKGEEIKKHLRVLIPKVRQEKGCLFDECIQNAANPDEFVFVEHWATKEDMDAHINGAPAAEFGANTADLMESPPNVIVYNDIW